jgi:hypothetical protein
LFAIGSAASDRRGGPFAHRVDRQDRRVRKSGLKERLRCVAIVMVAKVDVSWMNRQLATDMVP